MDKKPTKVNPNESKRINLKRIALRYLLVHALCGVLRLGYLGDGNAWQGPFFVDTDKDSFITAERYRAGLVIATGPNSVIRFSYQSVSKYNFWTLGFTLDSYDPRSNTLCRGDLGLKSPNNLARKMIDINYECDSLLHPENYTGPIFEEEHPDNSVLERTFQ